MGDFHFHIASTLGLLLGACLAAGVFADLLHLPKVTAFLLVGLLVGPSVMDLIPEGHVERFEPVLEFAMAIVLFNLGCEFTFKKVRRIAAHCLAVSATEILCTCGLVTIGLRLFGCSGGTSLLLGCLAVATAPATTILVLKEFRSEGPVTESTGFLVAMNNFACIVLFEFAFLAIHLIQGKLEIPLTEQMGVLLLDIAGSVLLGLAGGLVVSYGCGLLRMTRWLVLLVATTTFLLGICESLDIPYMVTFLVMGVTVANTSDMKGKIVDELDHLSGLLAVVFFAVHGTQLDVGAFAAAGMVGVIYIVCRMLGKWLGVYAAARATRQPLEVRHWLGSCLFAQAGAAIALSSIAVARDPELGKPIQDIILGSVVLFEIIGPLFIRQSLLRTGEVPLAQAIHHTSRTPLEQVRELGYRFRTGLGRHSDPKGAVDQVGGKVKVSDLLRKTKGIHQSADFDAVISHIEHSHDNTYPVVDDRMRVVGVIRYPLLSNVMFDDSVTQLVRAEDLVSETDAILYPDDPAARAFELFEAETDDCIPVVTREEPHELQGVVRRSDVMHTLITRRRKSK
ncbi:cation:proton antiporter domain-containing protein [Novipirellula artificiosorum]|uniref:Putative voltage-gated ClC-type chloride channel ClcB n=1 Tax=Novipirellula artificiosorum TaxID=2528016 RepID=A0A5C6DVD4_9BACT|nr:cation:proton antiporter [Novipirellula artificiosorum]TWU40568.1 putative voltage-gated ClC-type chloride channel ClcB [Novipirellula artificiosorum]